MLILKNDQDFETNLFLIFHILEILKIGEKEYLNSVVGMQLNGDYAAAYMGNQLQLHTVSNIIYHKIPLFFFIKKTFFLC